MRNNADPKGNMIINFSIMMETEQYQNAPTIWYGAHMQTFYSVTHIDKHYCIGLHKLTHFLFYFSYKRNWRGRNQTRDFEFRDIYP